MKNLFFLIALVASKSIWTNPLNVAEKYQLKKGDPNISSLNEITFGPEGILFIADNKAGKIFAIDTQEEKLLEEPKKFKLRDMETQLSDRLGIEKEDILIHDMAVHPLSKNIYLTLSLAKKDWVTSWKLMNDLAYSELLVKVDITTKEISEVVLENIPFSAFELQNIPHQDSLAQRRQSVMDMKYRANKLMFAGMSGDDFSANFQIIDFPFTEKTQTTTLEMFHYIHNQYETRSPINVFDTYQEQNKTKMLAVYYCSPLVTFNLEDFKHGDKVRGKTISELWPGISKPLDMLHYNFKEVDYVLVTLSSRGLALFKLEDIKNYTENFIESRKDLSFTDEFTVLKEGVPFKIFPGPVQQLDHFNENNFMALQRMENGFLDLKFRNKEYLSVF